MKAILAVLSVILLFHASDAEITCGELISGLFGRIIHLLSSQQIYNGSEYYIQSKNEARKIGIDEWSVLNNTDYFNPSRQTVFLIHGYIANRNKPYIVDLSNELTKTNDYNVIVIDWSSGSQTWNYINAAQTTFSVAEHLVNFLQMMKGQVSKLDDSASNNWKNLYLIGHSLGAHISGQIGNLLKEVNLSFKVKRITGLDPAQPCFKTIDLDMKLDKSDAEFVDVIHTQTGHGTGVNAFGLEEAIGHIDFYVNGGVMQPECETKSNFYTVINKMICSHKLVSYFFIETISYSKSTDCKFIGHSWDGSYSDAMRIYDDVSSGKVCSDCPEMGFNAVNYKNKSGKYLVILSTIKPYCEFKWEDRDRVIKGIEKLNTTTMLFGR